MPFADPQPISANILGVDTVLGRTTWELHQGALTGTWSGNLVRDFPGTATLVEGSDYASMTYAVTAGDKAAAVGGACSLGAGHALCVGTQSGGDGGATTYTETDSAFGVQIAAATNAPAAPSSPGGTNTGSNSGLSASSLSHGAPSPTQSNSAAGLGLSFGALAGLFLASYYLL
ncbi:hypothetical protein C8R46DRAFT_1197191 [Mycena filopes]|nr:hypothetical protein C8R46DRAFT_1197191 [Mycena filopes]